IEIKDRECNHHGYWGILDLLNPVSKQNMHEYGLQSRKVVEPTFMQQL
ncbi:hypothetical protein NPIL_387171, partial [Nephila pilipes]